MSQVLRQSSLSSGRLKSRESQSSTDIKKEAEEKIYEQKYKLEGYIGNLEDTRKDLLERRELILKGRYYHVFQQLSDTYKALEVYRTGIETLEGKMDGNPLIQKMTDELKFYTGFQEIIMGKMHVVETGIQGEFYRIGELKRMIGEKKVTLHEKNKRNLDLASQITKLRSILNGERNPQIEGDVTAYIDANANLANEILKGPRKSGQVEIMPKYSITRQGFYQEKRSQVSSRSSLPDIQTIKPISKGEYNDINKELKKTISRNLALKNQITMKTANFYYLFELLTESFHKTESELLKTQKKVHDQGLNGSLIFLLMNSKQKSIQNYDPITAKDVRNLGRSQSQFKRHPKQMDGEALDNVYTTFKTMIEVEEQKNDKTLDMLKNLKPEQIERFTPHQIMGIILLRPEAIKSIFNEFEQKRRRLNNLQDNLKAVKISQIK